MARTGLSAADVATAYDALVDAGIQPSIRAIRSQLGNTGSLKTIADHVRTLKTERWQAPGPALPDPLLQSLVTGAEAFWAELTEAADAHIEANDAQCNTQLEAMRAERDEAQRQTASMRDALSAHKDHIATLDKQLVESAKRQQAMLQQLQEIQDQYDQSRTLVSGLESNTITLTHERDDALDSLEGTQQSIDALHEQLQTQKREHEAIQLTHVQADKTNALELEAVQAALADTRQSLDLWESRKDQWEQDRESLNSQVVTLKNTAEFDQNEISELQQTCSALQFENSALRTEIEVTKSMATEAEKRQQAMLRTMSKEFAIVVQKARMVDQDSV